MKPIEDWDPMASPHRGNPVDMHAKLRATCPVAWSDRFDGFYALSRFEDVTRAALDVETFTSAQKTPIPEATGPDRPPRAPVEVDPPIHTDFRNLLNRFFEPDYIRRLEPVIRRTARELLGRCVSLGRTDAVEAFTFFMPIRVQCTLLGISVDDAELIKNTVNRIIDSAAEGDLDTQKVENDRLYDYIYGVVRARRALPHDPNDMISALIHEPVGGRMLTDDDVAGTIRLFLQAGHGTTTNALGSIIWHLASTPADQARLRAEPQIIPQAVEEILRAWTPVRMVGRRTTRETAIEGVCIPKGSRVALMVSSANRDAAAFDHADTVDFDRKPNRHIAFGYGIHRCVGASLARAQLRIAVEELLSLTDDFTMAGEVEFSTWTHLGPAKLPVTFTPRSQTHDTGEIHAGQRELSLVVAEIRQLADRVVELRLASAAGLELPDWDAGAHVEVLLPGGINRSYSLTGAQHDPKSWRIAVLRDSLGRGGSAALHRLSAGETLRVRAPRNRFPLAHAPAYHFVASGIGITPILPMIRAADESGIPWELDYVGRTRASLAYLDELPRRADVRIHLTGEKGRPSIADLLAGGRSEAEIYSCGSPAFLLGVEEAATRAGRKLHVEWFAPKPGVLNGADGSHETFTVSLRRSGVDVTVLPGQSIVDACAEAGVTIPASCFEGTCGSCLSTVLEGTPDHRDSFLTPEERSSNRLMAACVSKSMGNRLVLDW